MYYVNALIFSMILIATGSMVLFQNCTQNNLVMKNEALTTQILVPAPTTGRESLSSSSSSEIKKEVPSKNEDSH
jgi:hypothetical protein